MAILPYIPVGNIDPVAGLYSDNTEKNRVQDDKAGQRVDFINQKTGNWSWYYHFDDSNVFSALPAASVSGFPSFTPTRAQEIVMSNTKTFGPGAVNEVRASFFRTSTHKDEPKGSFAKLSDLGFVTGIGTLGINPSGPAGFPEYVPQIYFGSPRELVKHPKFIDMWHLGISSSMIPLWQRGGTPFHGSLDS